MSDQYFKDKAEELRTKLQARNLSFENINDTIYKVLKEVARDQRNACNQAYIKYEQISSSDYDVNLEDEILNAEIKSKIISEVKETIQVRLRSIIMNNEACDELACMRKDIGDIYVRRSDSFIFPLKGVENKLIFTPDRKLQSTIAFTLATAEELQEYFKGQKND